MADVHEWREEISTNARMLADTTERQSYEHRDWLSKVGVKTLYIEPGSPWENGCCESLNPKLRDELLNVHDAA